MESLLYSTCPSYNDLDPSHVQSHPNFSLLLSSTQSHSSLPPLPPSSALSHPSSHKGSNLSPPLTLPPLPHGQHSYHQGELVRSPDMHCDRLQPSGLPLSPPPVLPSTILHLPIHFDARSLPLTHSPPDSPSTLDNDQSLLPSGLDDPTLLRRPSPLPARSWPDVVTPVTKGVPLCGLAGANPHDQFKSIILHLPNF